MASSTLPVNKIDIYVCTHNRKLQTEVSLRNLKETKCDNRLIVFDDCSSEYDKPFLLQWADVVERMNVNHGIEKLRVEQFKYFMHSDAAFMYLTDNDAYHDPEWISVMMELYQVGNGVCPVTLYNANGHRASTEKDYGNYYIRETTPGVSILLDKDMVAQIVEDSRRRGGLFAARGGFDWRIGELFRNIITSKISYLEHFGHGGLHASADVYDPGDMAENPTQFLVDERIRLCQYFSENAK